MYNCDFCINLKRINYSNKKSGVGQQESIKII